MNHNHRNKTIKGMPNDLWTKLKHFALDEHLGISTLIIKILRQWVQGKEGER